MIAQLAATILIGAIQPCQEPKPVLALRTFSQAMEPLTKSANIRITAKPSILNSPVVVSLNADGDPFVRLKDLCTLLGLETEFDPESRDLKVTVSSKGQPKLSNAQRMAATIRALRDSLKSVQSMTPRQRYAESRRIQAIADAEKEHTLSNQLSERARMILSTTISREMVCISPLLFGDIGAISNTLSQPYRKGQDLPMSSDSMQLANLVVQGKGTEVFDVLDPNDLEAQSTSATSSISQTFKQQYAGFNIDDPIIHFMHVSSNDSIYLFCRAFNPAEYKPIDIFSIPLVSGNAVVPDQQNLPNLTKRFKPESFTKNRRFVGLYTLGALAATQSMDFACWFEWMPSTWFKGEEGTISEGLKNSLYPNSRFQEIRQAMTVRNYDRLIPPATEDWTPFLRVFHAMEKSRITRNELTVMVNGFTEQEGKSLDRISNETSFTTSAYDAILHGSSLLKVALNAIKPDQNLLDIGYQDLPKEARSEILRYFTGDYVWMNYPSYTHPLNAPLQLKSNLHMSIEKEGDHQKLQLKLTIPARPGRKAPQSIEFELELK